MGKGKFLKWLKAAVIRALKTMAQTAIASLGTSAMMAEVRWEFVLTSAGLAGVLSILMFLQGLPEVNN